MCIANNVKDHLSPQYMVYCGEHTMGCGGSLSLGDNWEQLIDQGTVPEECIPYANNDGMCPDECWDGTPITTGMLKALFFLGEVPRFQESEQLRRRFS